MVEDALADAGLVEPFQETGLGFGFGLLLAEGEFGFFQFKLGGLVFGFAEGADIPAEMAQGAEPGGEFRGGFAVPVIYQAGIEAGHDFGEMVGHLAGAGFQFAGGGLVWGGGLGAEGEFPPEFPFGKAAGAPFAYVLGG